MRTTCIVICVVVLSSWMGAAAGTGTPLSGSPGDHLDCNLGGTVSSWQCCLDSVGSPYFPVQIESVLVHYHDVCMGVVYDATTDASGHYSLPGLASPDTGCDYCLTAEFGGTPPGQPITPYDAYLVMAYILAAEDLQDCPFDVPGLGTIYPQQVAADVSCNGTISPFDASLMLHYSVGAVSAFPCPDPYKFYALSDTCTHDCGASIDWEGILIGDVSPAVCPAGSVSTDTVFARLGQATYHGTSVDVPISLVNAHDVLSFLFDLSYDASDLMVAGAVLAGGAETYIIARAASGGSLRIAAAGSGQEIRGDTLVTVVTFERNYPEEEFCGRLTLNSAVFNEGDPPGGVIDYCTRPWDGITSVTDVGNDQGRQVRLRWARTWHDDAATDTSVTAYSILRRVDQNLRAGGREERTPLTGLGYPPGEWEFVKTVPAWGEDAYVTTCGTLCDSTAAEGICWSVFFIRAETDIPSVYFDCLPDSGYSVDNLAPAPPPGLMMASPTEVAWEDVPDDDFDYYTVYGSESAVLDGSETLIGYTAGLQMDVTDDVFGHYHVTATDFSGNEGDASSVQNSYAGAPRSVLPEAFALWQNTPNPFEAGTVIRFDLPEAAAVSLTVFDVNGRAVARLTDEEWRAGRHSVMWNGEDQAGNRVGPGVYFVRMDAGGFSAIRKMMLLR